MGAMQSLRRHFSNDNSTTTSNQPVTTDTIENGFSLNDINTNVNNTNNRSSMTSNENLPFQTTNNSRLNLLSQLISFNSNGRANNASNAVNQPKRSSKSHANDVVNVSFASQFYMTGKKIKALANQTHSFLFGDHLDVNFIVSHKPVNFPYELPSFETPSDYLQSLINIRKDTVKLVKYVEKEYCSVNNLLGNSNVNDVREMKYNIEFRFDSDVDVKIKIHYFATEKFVFSQEEECNQLSYMCACSRFTHSNVNKSNEMAATSATNAPHSQSLKCFCLNDDTRPIVYKKGVNVLFRQPKHVLVPSKFHMSNWQFNLHDNYFPVVIECRPVDEHLRLKHAHVTLAYIDKSQTILNANSQINNNASSNPLPNVNVNVNLNSQKEMTTNLNTKSASVGCLSQITYSFNLKPIKQKQFINGILYSLQEIYGIEKKCSPEHDSLSSSNDQLNDEQSTTNPLQVAKPKSLTHVSSASLLSSSTATTTTSSSTASCSDESKLSDTDETTEYTNATTKSNDKVESPATLAEIKVVNEVETLREQTKYDQEADQKGVECVICMCEVRNTLILPCRHLCLCRICAVNLRIQSNNCPICRIPFVALIQLKLYKKKKSNDETKTEAIDYAKQLPKLELQDLNVINEITTSNTDGNGNVIIEIRNKRIVSTDKNEMLVNSENVPVVKSKRSQLAMLYECVSIYEAFDEPQTKHRAIKDAKDTRNVNTKQSKSSDFKSKKSNGNPSENSKKSKIKSRNKNLQQKMEDKVKCGTENQAMSTSTQVEHGEQMLENQSQNVASSNQIINSKQSLSDFKFDIDTNGQKKLNLIANSTLSNSKSINNKENRSCSVIITSSNNSTLNSNYAVDNLKLKKIKSASSSVLNAGVNNMKAIYKHSSNLNVATGNNVKLEDAIHSNVIIRDIALSNTHLDAEKANNIHLNNIDTE